MPALPCLVCACMVRGALLLALLPIALSGLALAQPVQPDARVSVPAESVSVGERFPLTLRITHDGRRAPLFPNPEAGDTLLGDFELLRRTAAGTGALPGGLHTDSATYEATTFALDTATVRGFRLRLAAPGDTIAVAVAPARVPVRSALAPGDSTLHDLAPLAGFPWPVWYWVALALGAVGAVPLWMRLRRRFPRARPQPAPEPPRTAFEEAHARVTALAGTNPNDPEAVKALFVELSDVLRGYLDRRMGIPALERTTPETLDLLRAAALPPPVVEHTGRLLHAADLVKFASMQPDRAFVERALAETHRTLDDLEASLVKATSVLPT